MTNHALDRIEIRTDLPWTWRYGQILRNWGARRRVRKLVEHDDHILDDIGVTRNEVLWASYLPLSTNAALALAERSRRRRLTGRG